MKPQKFLALVQHILKAVIGFLLNSNYYCVYTLDEKVYRLLVTVSTLLIEKVAFRKFYIDCMLA